MDQHGAADLGAAPALTVAATPQTTPQTGGKKKRDDRFDSRFEPDFSAQLGKGTFGTVYEARDNGHICAVKVIDTFRVPVWRIERECVIMESLDHPNVIRILGHGRGTVPGMPHEAHYFIFMEKAGVDFFDEVLAYEKEGMPEQVARGFLRQLLAGVKLCHDNGVAVRDLKLENLLLAPDGVLKIIDFGLSHQYQRKGPAGPYDRSVLLSDACGSPAYMSPEVYALRTAWRGGYDGFTADVWCIGVILFAMCHGFFPFSLPCPKKDARYEHVLARQSDSARACSTTHEVLASYERPVRNSELLVDLLDQMLTIDPTRRITVEEALSHPFLIDAGEAPPAAPTGFDAPAPVAAVADTATATATPAAATDAPLHAAVTDPAAAAYRSLSSDSSPSYRSLAASPEGSGSVESTTATYRSLGLDGAERLERLPLPRLERQAAFSWLPL